MLEAGIQTYGQNEDLFNLKHFITLPLGPLAPVKTIYGLLVFAT